MMSRFPILTLLGYLLRLIAIICPLAGLAAKSEIGGPGFAASIVVGLVIWVYAEIIGVALSIENNTYHSRQSLAEVARAFGEHSATPVVAHRTRPQSIGIGTTSPPVDPALDFSLSQEDDADEDALPESWEELTFLPSRDVRGNALELVMVGPSGRNVLDLFPCSLEKPRKDIESVMPLVRDRLRQGEWEYYGMNSEGYPIYRRDYKGEQEGRDMTRPRRAPIVRSKQGPRRPAKSTRQEE